MEALYVALSGCTSGDHDGSRTAVACGGRCLILYKHEIFKTGPLAEGAHVIRFEAIWQRNPASTKNYISFDALKASTD